MKPTNELPCHPDTRRTDHADMIHGVSVPDPYRWLEAVDSPEISQWIDAQNEYTNAVLEGIQFRAQIREHMEALACFEIVGTPKQAGERVFFTLQSPDARQASLVWSPVGAEDTPITILDPEALSDDATIAIAGFEPSPSGRYLAYGLAEAGSDWQRWFVYDVEKGSLLGDALEWLKFPDPSWRKDESGFFYASVTPAEVQEMYKAPTAGRLLRFHRLGNPQSEDRIYFEQPDEPKWLFSGKVTADDRYLIIRIQRGTYRRHRLAYIDLADPALQVRNLVGTFEDMYLFLGSCGDELYFLTNRDAPLGRVIAMDLHDSEPGAWREVIPESERVLQYGLFAGERFALIGLSDASSVVGIYDRNGKCLQDVALPSRGTVPLLTASSEGARIYFLYSDPAFPWQVLVHEPGANETRPMRTQQLAFDPTEYITEQHHYESQDGTRVPIFITRKRTTAVGPETPTCLYGYGGFNSPESPTFRIHHLSWLEMGGQLAVAGIRGGGEYGRDWHQAGAKAQRPNVFADFIAAAEWLIETQRTSTSKLVIQGRSNGGLLVGACMTQRPDLFGCCLPAVGVLDMLRFHLFTVGSYWTSDYGSPDAPDMFPILLGYSPYHNVHEGTDYPPTMVTTADHDDRVYPAHSFKFAAALQHAQAGDAPVALRVDARAGHGLGKPKDKQLDEYADQWAFALNALNAKPTF